MGIIIYQNDQFDKFFQCTNPHRTSLWIYYQSWVCKKYEIIWSILAPIIRLIVYQISLTKLKTTVENKTGIINTTNQMSLKQDELPLLRKNPKTYKINKSKIFNCQDVILNRVPTNNLPIESWIILMSHPFTSQ